ncbi:MAG TPA: hypothetical protein VFF17_14045 [Thermoanaerobaculia bacterium]|nr:hypothetical protein [Thermoanaerobaculia bacterium]
MEQAVELLHLSRPEAIERIRAKLKELTDDEHCGCSVAGDRGIFCGGFRSLSDKEFRGRFSWIARQRPRASRQELEGLVSLYHLGRQEAGRADLCCDVETREHCGCDGWNRFDNAKLEKFVKELTGVSVRVG